MTISAQEIKFSTKDFFSKCEQVRRKLWIWSDLLNKASTLYKTQEHHTLNNYTYFFKEFKRKHQ